MPMLLLLTGLEPRGATAASLGAILITAVAGVAFYAARGEVHVGYAALVGIPASMGAVLGTACQQRISGRSLVLAFATFVAATGVWLIAS